MILSSVFDQRKHFNKKIKMPQKEYKEKNLVVDVVHKSKIKTKRNTKSNDSIMDSMIRNKMCTHIKPY